MIKEILVSLFKYLLILLLLFVFFFFIIFIFNVFQFIKIDDTKDIFNDIFTFIFIPTFLHSTYNSFILSIFIYGILVLNYQKKFEVFSFFIPIIITTFFIFIILFLFKPNQNNAFFNNIDDARIFFTERSFFDYQDNIPKEFEKSFFENNIEKKIEDQKMKNILKNFYTFDYKTDKYILLENIFDKDKKNLLNIFYNIGFLKKRKFYFDVIEKDNLKNVILIEDKQVKTYSNFKIKYIVDKIIIELPDTKEKIEFPKEILREFSIYDNKITKTLFDSFINMTFKFLKYNKFWENLLLWFAVSFFIISFSTLILIKNYPFVSMSIKFLFLLVFYVSFGYIFDIYNANFYLLGKQLLFLRSIALSSIIIIIALILFAVKVVFLKANNWEKD
ncbi:MAG: hypothetical protein A2086_03500 [Spirochaetes bacterium GWD1_27_9]|nr:MAG: hypothetical protein A2Z98_09840 [Spirochaetes bacterium GWB1_27_13]OHD25349.1 MAG: hypothetical protein A2Y34_00060 [Spirochaetes bacterium GWC1_27_15]OHD31121.1 MAG: hypothetical protein A2086_03500 [Spirochaetes bacterium GWD1_27_9]